MWKIALAFVAFAALALFVLSRGGDIDLSGEKHGVDTHEPAASTAPEAAASVPAAAASVASAAASQ